MQSRHQPADPLLNPVEAGAFLRISPTTLQAWRVNHRQILPYVKVGNLVRYRLSVLNAFLEGREVAQ